MHSIRKSAEPQTLKAWKLQMRASTQNLTYNNLPTAIKNSIKDSLLREQGYLCAYTLQRLARIEDCHIEHVQPQNIASRLDLEYGNMAACFPRDGGDTSHGYGAPVKAGIAVTLNQNFVTPHSMGCEQRFHYNDKGQIIAEASDIAADKTIEILKLNHHVLADLRKRAIEAHGLTLRKGSMRSPKRPMSASQARRFAIEVLRFGENQQLEPFCEALSQVACKYAAKEEARAQRMKANR